MKRDLLEVGAAGRTLMGIHLDAAQRQEIVDQPLHALGLVLHERQEALARDLVLLGRALQRFDEAQERGQRRAQFVACMGDEIGAHALGLLLARQVPEQYEDHLLRLEGAYGGDISFEMARHGHMQFVIDTPRAAMLENRLHRVQYGGGPYGGRNVLVVRVHVEKIPRLAIGARHHAMGIEQHDGIRQGTDQRP